MIVGFIGPASQPAGAARIEVKFLIDANGDYMLAGRWQNEIESAAFANSDKARIDSLLAPIWKKLKIIWNGSGFFKKSALTLKSRIKRFPYTGGNFGISSAPPRAEAGHTARIFVPKIRSLFLISRMSLLVTLRGIEPRFKP